MSLIQIALMVVGIVLALVGMKKQKQGAVWGQPAAIVGALLAIGSALYSSFGTITGAGGSAASQRELRYQDLQHAFLGSYIKEAANPKKVGVIVDSYYLYDAFGDKLATPMANKPLEGLKRTVGADVVVTSIVPKKIDKSKLPKDASGNVIDPGMMMMDPMNSALNGKNVKGCLDDLKDCDVIVIMAATDSNLPYFKILPMLKKGTWLAANSSGNYNALAKAFQDSGKGVGGSMLAVSCSKASAIYDESIPRKDQAAYDRRYILITKDNYQQTIPAAQKK